MSSGKSLTEYREKIIQEWLDKFHQNPFFSQSQPPIDYEFVETMLSVYPMDVLRRELNKMHMWLLADPRRRKKNYRRFIINWMNNLDRNYVIQYKREDY